VGSVFPEPAASVMVAEIHQALHSHCHTMGRNIAKHEMRFGHVIPDWTAIPDQHVKVVMIPQMTHNAILSNDASIQMIVDEILIASSYN